MRSQKKVRVLLSKVGLDGHDRGVVLVAMALKDAGMEVIYLGRHQTAEKIAQAAIQEDVDLIGLSCLSGAHVELFSEVIRLLRHKNAAGIPVIGGGIIPDEDIPALKEAGIRAIFQPGTSLEEIIQWTDKNIKPGK